MLWAADEIWKDACKCKSPSRKVASWPRDSIHCMELGICVASTIDDIDDGTPLLEAAKGTR